ncbi:MAG: DUF1311 domain-containing protein [Proteobacteria bacterium]|nr:DUF1311 domain-containing protein [Pseudomonadota bacterium]
MRNIKTLIYSLSILAITWGCCSETMAQEQPHFGRPPQIESQQNLNTPLNLSPTQPPKALAVDSEIIVISGYEVSNSGKHVRVFIDRPGRNVLLILTSYEKVAWHVDASPSTNIKGIIASGYKLPVVFTTTSTLGFLVDLPYVSQVESINFQTLLNQLNGWLGISEIDVFRGQYSIPPLVSVSEPDAPSDMLTLTGLRPQKPKNDFSFELTTNEYTKARWSLTGPHNNENKPYHQWGRLAFSKSGDMLYLLINDQLEVINRSNNEKFVATLPPDFPRFSWPKDVAYDTHRNIVTVVCSFDGKSLIYRFDANKRSWIDFHSLNNIEILSLAYDEKLDRYVAWANERVDLFTSIKKGAPIRDVKIDSGNLLFISNEVKVLFHQKIIGHLPGFDKLYDINNSRAYRITIIPKGDDIALVYINNGSVRIIWYYNVDTQTGLLTYKHLKDRHEAPVAGNNFWGYAVKQPGTDAVNVFIKESRDLKIPPITDNPILVTENNQVEIETQKPGQDDFDYNRVINNSPRYSPLEIAVRQNNLEEAKLLLSERAVKDEIEDSKAMMWAINESSVEMLELLLDNGIPITDDRAIEAVTNINRYKTAKLKVLIAHGLDVTRKYSRKMPIITEVSPGIININSDVEQTVSKTLMEWVMESKPHDLDTLLILAEACSKLGGKELLCELQDADKELNEKYKILLKELSKAERQKLRNEQRAWIRIRDVKCKVTLQKDSMNKWFKYITADQARASCVIDETRRRMTELSAKQNTTVIPPDEKVGGLSIVEWVKRYWEWSKSFPEDQAPADDSTGSRCMEKQSGNIIMLAGSSESSPVVRRCEVPVDKYIFFPVLTNIARDKSIDTHRHESLLLVLDEMTRNVSSMYAQIDGKAIENIKSYRLSTGFFSLKVADGESNAASDGYWLAVVGIV